MGNRFNINKIYDASLLSSTALSKFMKQQEYINNIMKPSLVDSMLKQKERVNSIVGSSQLNAIKQQQEKLSGIFNSSVFDVLKKQQSQVYDLFNSSAMMGVIRQQERMKELLGTSMFDSLLNEQNKMSNILNSSIINSINIAPSILSDFTNINSIAKSMRNGAMHTELLNSINKSFSYGLFLKLDRGNITLDDTIDLIQENFSNKLKNIPQGLISFEGMVQILVAIILFIYAQISSFESEKNITRKIEQLESNVMAQLSQQLLPDNEAKTYYIVKRRVNLRANFNTESTIINLLHPNQRVELIEKNKKWIYVKYFDYIDGVQKMGWAYKKYLQIEK